MRYKFKHSFVCIQEQSNTVVKDMSYLAHV